VQGSLDGFLNLDKPPGFTSHDCVAKVRYLLKTKRIGHGGTLDPAATGVLPLAIGRATRLLQFLNPDKAYRATIRFGVATTTDDLEGDIVTQQPTPELTLATVAAALPKFEGQIQQVPPIYSAIQVQGQRLYQLARQGKSVDIPSRTVRVDRIEILAWRPGDFPELDVAIACGPGTYIRAIARDLGLSLKTGATLARLIRTQSSGFHLDNGLTLEQLVNQIQAGTFCPIPPELGLQHLEAVTLSTDAAKRWCQGQKIFITFPQIPLQSSLRIQNPGQQFLGIGQTEAIDHQPCLIPKMVFAPWASAG